MALIPELWLGILYGLGIALLYAVCHLVLLRILWAPLVAQKRYARWAHLLLNPPIIFVIFLALNQAQIRLTAEALPAISVLPAAAIGLALYVLFFFIVLYPKLQPHPATGSK